MNLCCSPGYGGPGTFYGIEKSWPPGEIWLVQNGTHVCDFVNFTIFVWKTGFLDPKLEEIEIVFFKPEAARFFNSVESSWPPLTRATT